MYKRQVYNGHTQLNRNSYNRFDKPGNVANGILENTAILTGGNIFTPSESVSPGILSVTGLQASIPKALEGRRGSFAKWVTDSKNPLTARVMVNRVWAYHFGQGIAGNPNNFGATGDKPTHPLLLDWLTSEAQEFQLESSEYYWLKIAPHSVVMDVLLQVEVVAGRTQQFSLNVDPPVSYTHLTLPTICSV